MCTVPDIRTNLEVKLKTVKKTHTDAINLDPDFRIVFHDFTFDNNNCSSTTLLINVEMNRYMLLTPFWGWPGRIPEVDLDNMDDSVFVLNKRYVNVAISLAQHSTSRLKWSVLYSQAPLDAKRLRGYLYLSRTLLGQVTWPRPINTVIANSIYFDKPQSGYSNSRV